MMQLKAARNKCADMDYFQQGKVTGDKSCDFKAHLKECENKQYVCLESVKYPGWFLSMREDGGMVSNKDDKEAQFCVQVEVRIMVVASYPGFPRVRFLSLTV